MNNITTHTTSDNIEGANNIRFFATLAVIVFHVSGSSIYNTHDTSLFYWLIGDLVFSSTHFCVPFFFLLSGMLNIRNKYTANIFFQRRTKRVLIPFLFWGIIYSIVIYFYQTVKNNPINAIISLKNFILFQGEFRNYIYHFWFIYTLLLLYLITPLIKQKIVYFIKYKTLFFIIWGLSAIGYSNNEHFIIHLIISFLYYLGFYILGFLLKDIELSSKKTTSFLFVGYIVFCLLITYLNYLIFYNNLAFDKIYLVLKTASTILISITYFILLKNVKLENKLFVNIRNKTNNYSYGIYILHAPILLMIERLGLSWKSIFPVIGIILVSTICFSLSFILIYIGKKIKYIERLVN